MDNAQFAVWRTKLAPLLYDWFIHHNLNWPTQTCRWGSRIEDSLHKSKYRVYFSEQTDDSAPQTLVMAHADVLKPHIASCEAVSNWTETSTCPYIKTVKTINHPGEVNKVREIPQQPELLVTHTDERELYVWNMDKQPNRKDPPKEKPDKKALHPHTPSTPDLTLVGHQEPAQFPLAASAVAPAVASGGSDRLVLVWQLEDHISSLVAGPGAAAAAGKGSTLQARNRLEGHGNTVEDVVFQPGSSEVLVSVGDDKQVLFWDTRAGSAPTRVLANAHGSSPDVQCVDWSGLSEHLIATGGQDGSLKVWDTRKASTSADALHTFTTHSAGIIRLEWHPQAKEVLASGGEDHVVIIWKLDGSQQRDGGASTSQATPEPEAKKPKRSAVAEQQPPELIFQHYGHRRGRVVDFQWHPAEPWTLLSVSDNAEDKEVSGGGLQIWRINDLLYRPEPEVLAELEAHREFILEGRNPPAAPKVIAPSAAPADAEQAPGEGAKDEQGDDDMES